MFGVLLATGLGLTAYFRHAALTQFQLAVFELADALYARTDIAPDGRVIPPDLVDLRAERTYSGRYWQIAELGSDGQIHAIAKSQSLFDRALQGPPAGAAAMTGQNLGKPVWYDVRGPVDSRLRAVAFMSRVAGRKEPLIFMAAEDREPVDASARHFAALTGFALIALGVGVTFAVVVQVRLGLRPLFDLGKELVHVRYGRAARLNGAYPSEIEPLAREINALLDHNQEVVERQRTHVGNLAHALKTPIAVMTSEAAGDDGDLARVVLRQTDQMRAHVDHHLRRARAAARSQSSGESTAVEPALDELAGMLERVFQDKGVEIDWRSPEALAFRGERQDFLEIVGNVLENACKYGRRRVRVAASAAPGARLRIVIEDDGRGLAAEDRSAVLRRGARLDESEPGSGLGLSIVDELTRAYGGALTLGESSMGGLAVTLDLPRADLPATAELL